MNAPIALVTGAGGFVCRHIVAALLAGGWRVIALDRAFDAALRAEWAERVDFVAGEAAHLPYVQVDALVHGAALTASPETLRIKPEAYLREHVDTALDILAWAAQHVAGRTLLVSSDAVFSKTPPGAIAEDAPTQPIGMYGIAKVLLEQTAQTLRHDYGRDVIAIRLGAIYGQGELPRPSRPRVSRVARMVNDALLNDCISLDETVRTQAWTYAADVGAAARALLEEPTLAHALYHVASEETISAEQMADAIKALLPDVTIQHESGDALPDLRQHTLSNRRLREDTGFAAWTPFAQGLAETVEWQRAQLAVAS